jgi:hypothetical protein
VPLKTAHNNNNNNNAYLLHSDLKKKHLILILSIYKYRFNYVNIMIKSLLKLKKCKTKNSLFHFLNNCNLKKDGCFKNVSRGY